MSLSERLARRLATVLLRGDWDSSSILRRSKAFLGRSTLASQRGLARELLDAHPRAYPPSRDWIIGFLRGSRRFNRIAKSRNALAALYRAEAAPDFSPVPGLAGLKVSKFVLPKELAAWFGISSDQLDWFAGAWRRPSRQSTAAFRHYSYAFVPRAVGPPRLIESPKPRLKSMQRQVLREILDAIPVHACAHGFVPGRSCLGSAQLHAAESVVATVDLKDFFLSTPINRVYGIFRAMGYPWKVAWLLTGLCTTVTPRDVFQQPGSQPPPEWTAIKLHERAHLPQGAPTSPALANLAARRLDARLLGLARSCDANYSRYADDLTFSGDDGFARGIRGFLAAVELIAKEEGYALNHRKTRIMRRGGAQRVTGLIVNDHLNVPRTSYDRLKATLHNCVKHGPRAQNKNGLVDFRAHLEGRVVWVENVNPRRGARLRQIFDRINW